MRLGISARRRIAAVATLAALIALAVTLLIALGAAGGGSQGSATSTVWLCRPGADANPCEGDLTATVVAASGARSVVQARSAARSPFDCFYVYPTVGGQSPPGSALRAGPAERLVATAQAARFSEVCRVWSPMYRQQSLSSLVTSVMTGDRRATDDAYRSLLAGWRDFLAQTHARPFVLIGHSQGAALLIRLVREQIDADPRLRRRLVSAILLGANVVVPTGRTVGGSFRHVPACAAAAQTGCVIAYSSFPAEPPVNSLFGRPGRGISLLSGQTETTGEDVLCVNPAALAPNGAQGALMPFAAPDASTGSGAPIHTPWVTYPELYSARCRSEDGASWLQVDQVTGPTDTRPRVSELDGPMWGYHIADVNIALGNLVAVVRAQENGFNG